jgi:hypothetical protein
MDECILYPEQYQLIYNVSFMLLASSMYALYKRLYFMSFGTGCVFLTSINYWYHPDYSWRRYLDMAMVQVMVNSQFYVARNAQYRKPFYIIYFVAIGMYPIGVYYYYQKLYWHSTYAHCLLHLFANIANFILYSGRVYAIESVKSSESKL